MKNRYVVIGGANHFLLEGIRQVASTACQVSGCYNNPADWLRALSDDHVDLAIVEATERGWDIGTLLDRLPALSRDLAVIALVPGNRLYECSFMLAGTGRRIELLPVSVSSDTLVGTIRRSLEELDRGDSLPPAALVASLTDRQQNILLLLCMGESTKRIAGILNISTRTVEFHKYRMMKTLGVTTTTQLVLLGVEAGLGVPAARLAAAGAGGHLH
jgi:DNA-binding NarL/FixJ family response regulator